MSYEYDYKAGYLRIKEILDNNLKVNEVDKIPDETAFTFDNAYYGWVTGVFVDIRDSSKLFSIDDKEEVSKIIRSFTSEIIEILRDDTNLREIGIRGDCVYAIYASPSKVDESKIFDKVCYINTYLKLLNKMLSQREYPIIEVGIGMATSKELVVKAGRKGVGINNLVWIGDAVSRASNLSSLGGQKGISTIVLSSLSFDNIKEEYKKLYGDKGLSWFSEGYSKDYGTYYHCEVIEVDFNSWIDEL